MSAGIRAGSSNDGYVQVNGNDIITALSGGNVGIGNTSPSTKLHVNGTVTATNFIGAFSGNSNISVDDWIVHTGDTDTKLGFPAADQIQFDTGGTNYLKLHRYASVNFVEVGSGAHISLAANGANSRGIMIGDGNASSTGQLFLQAGGGSTGFGGGIRLYSHANTTNAGGVYIGKSLNSSGSIILGNGGTTPSHEYLKITSTGKSLFKSQGANAVWISLLDNNSTNEIWRVGQAADGDGYVEVLEDGGTVGCKLDASGNSFTMGNFGVGVASPGTKLTVSGAVHITSTANTNKNVDGCIIERSSTDGIVHISAGRTGGNYSGLNFYVAGNSGGSGANTKLRHLIDYQGNFRWYGSDGTTQRMRISNTGQIGINMDPSADAQVCIKNSNDSNFNVFDVYNDNGNKMGGFSQDSTGNGTIGSRTNGGDLNVMLRSSGNSYFKGGRLLIGTDAHSISSSEMFEVKHVSTGFSYFENDNTSGYAPIYINNKGSNSGFAPIITITDGGGNRGGLGLDNTETLRVHGQGGVEIYGGGTMGGGTQTAKFSSSSGESYLTIVGNKAPAGTGGNLILQNLDTTTQAASTLQFADAGGQTIAAINGVSVDQNTNEGFITFSTRPSNGTPTKWMDITPTGELRTYVNKSAYNNCQRYQWGGHAASSATFSVSIPVLGNGNIYKITAMFAHHNASHSCYREGTYGAYSGHSGMQITNDNVSNHTSSNAGSWTITRGSAGQPVVVTKTAGTYNGTGYWFVHVIAGTS